MSEFQQVTYPITLVCAGNRRKEQNQVRKSKGFSWGSAGLYTSLFTGVAMAEVIRRAKPTRKARFVCMEGADQLVSISCFTSIAAGWADDDLAQWLLWNLREAELGNGPQPRHHARLSDERREASTRSRKASSSGRTRPDRRAEREVAEEVDYHGRAE